MMNKTIIHKPGYIQDGKLDHQCGRIIIYDGYIIISAGTSADHNYLLRAHASRYRINKDEVISNATRLYYRRENYGLAISGVRKIDDEDYERHSEEYRQLIENKPRKGD